MTNLFEIIDNLVWTFETNTIFGVWVAVMLGATFASFAGVLIDRLPHQMGWIEDPKENYTIAYPPSQCNGCQSRLGIIDLIPVLGWVLTRGKCRACGAKIPALYPATELMMAILFALCVIAFEETSVILSAWLLLGCGYVITMLDLRHHWIPEVISAPLLWIGLMASPFEPDVYLRIYAAVLGGLLMLATFWIVGHRVKEDVYSGGDVALAMVGGAWVGQTYLSTFLLMGSLFFAAHCIWEKRKNVKWVPFGPALVLSLLATAFFAHVFG